MVLDPFDYLATGFFFLAVFHTLVSPVLFGKGEALIDYAWQRSGGKMTRSHWLYFFGVLVRYLGEVEIIFGLWLLPLLMVSLYRFGWNATLEKLKLKTEYTEALFVAVLMIISSAQPILYISQRLIGCFARITKDSVTCWWFLILTLGPIFGSFITEASAITISALLLAEKFFCLNPKQSLAYGTIGLLFFNVSIGGALTNYAAPPVVLVSQKWQWDSFYMLIHFGFVFVCGIVLANLLYYFVFQEEFKRLEKERLSLLAETGQAESLREKIPLWIVIGNIGFLVSTVIIKDYFLLLFGILVFFLSFVDATKPYQGEIPLQKAFLVGFFLASLEVFGNLQSWWINRLLSHLSFLPLYVVSVMLSSFNDNALISYLATLIVPELDEMKKRAIIGGALSGGGLTIIANAPNLVGLSLLRKFFPDGIASTKLFIMALVPTILVAILFIFKEWIFK